MSQNATSLVNLWIEELELAQSYPERYRDVGRVERLLFRFFKISRQKLR